MNNIRKQLNLLFSYDNGAEDELRPLRGRPVSMGAADPRAQHIARCALELLGLNAPGAEAKWVQPVSSLSAQITESSEVQSFLETAAVSALRISGTVGGGGSPRTLQISTNVSIASDFDVGVIFTKTTSDQITAENVADVVLVTSLNGSPLQALQLALQQMYGPILLEKTKEGASKLDPKTESAFEALKLAISSAVQRGGTAGRGGLSEEDVRNCASRASRAL
eukprot:5833782-Pleurochrysis_carterae.AAC.2